MVKQIISEVTNEKLEEVINLQEKMGNPFIVLVKPRAKKNVVEFDSDTAAFDIVEDKLVFDFLEIEGFELNIGKIKKIVYEEFGKDKLVIHIYLKHGNVYILHFMDK